MCIRWRSDLLCRSHLCLEQLIYIWTIIAEREQRITRCSVHKSEWHSTSISNDENVDNCNNKKRTPKMVRRKILTLVINNLLVLNYNITEFGRLNLWKNSFKLHGKGQSLLTFFPVILLKENSSFEFNIFIILWIFS